MYFVQKSVVQAGWEGTADTQCQLRWLKGWGLELSTISIYCCDFSMWQLQGRWTPHMLAQGSRGVYPERERAKQKPYGLLVTQPQKSHASFLLHCLGGRSHTPPPRFRRREHRPPLLCGKHAGPIVRACGMGDISWWVHLRKVQSAPTLFLSEKHFLYFKT